MCATTWQSGKNIVKFFVSPEHARLTLKADKITAYVVFCLLRENVKTHNESSHYTKNQIKSLLKPLNFSSRKWTRVFKAGDNIFWNCEHKKLYLRSYKKVTQNLERVTGDKIDFNYKFAREVELEITSQDTSATIGSKLYFSWFLARGEITIARDTIRDLFGLSHDRQRNYEMILDHLIIVHHNYAHIDSEKYKQNPQELPEHHYSFRYERFTDDHVSSHEAIQYQLPNTFHVSRDVGTKDQRSTRNASQSLRKAIRARSWHTESYEQNQALYSEYWRDFERNNGSEYVRAYMQGIKRLWLSSHYI